MNAALNPQFNLAAPESLAMRVSMMMRREMFGPFISELQPRESEVILDVGVTSDQSYDNSNYFEELYPQKRNIVAVDLQDASSLEKYYRGVLFVRANGLNLPFMD